MPDGRDPVTVEQAMTCHPISIAPDAPVETAMAVMRARRIRHLPVVDDGERLVGVISDRDVRSMILAPAVDEFLPTDARHHLAGTIASLRDISGHVPAAGVSGRRGRRRQRHRVRKR